VDADRYFSVDVEADGPIPGVYSMLAFGICVAGRFDGRSFEHLDPCAKTFYRELRPITSESDPAALRVSGLDRSELARSGCDPADAMREAADWVRENAEGDRPVLAGYPIVFDLMFIHWYFVKFLGESPFDFSGGLDMKTMYQQKARVPWALAGRNDLPDFLRPEAKHTHNALDDAVEQGGIFARLFEWAGGQE